MSPKESDPSALSNASGRKPFEKQYVRQLLPWLLGLCLGGVLSKAVRLPALAQWGFADSGISGVLPSFFFASLLGLVFSVWYRPVHACAMAFFGSVLYELDQLFGLPFTPAFMSSHRTFDPWDLVAVVLGVVFAFAIQKWVELGKRPPARPNSV